jgi:hypothetical protein
MKLNPSTVPTFASSRTRSRTISDRQSRPADDEGAGSGPQLIASPPVHAPAGFSFAFRFGFERRGSILLTSRTKRETNRVCRRKRRYDLIGGAVLRCRGRRLAPRAAHLQAGLFILVRARSIIKEFLR